MVDFLVKIHYNVFAYKINKHKNSKAVTAL